MRRKHGVPVGVMVLALTLLAGRVWAQDPVAPPPQEPQTQQNQQPAPAPAATAGKKAPAAKPAAPVKKGKQPYTGPTNVIELPPTPMLDGEGKQRVDPDGKPMFNPPVRQQRDKLGHPEFDEKGQPVFQTATELGFDEKGHKLHVKTVKPPKTIAVSITKGTLTVDGMIGKAALNYEISDFKFVYLYAPWIGTAIVSNVPFPGSKEEPNVFDEHTLTVTVDDHQFQVYSDKILLGKGKKALPGYVAVDRDFKLPTQVPVMGYGATLKAPYLWPGAKPNPESKAYVKPPPVPKNLQPTLLLPPCPPGQMRASNRVILPGDTSPPEPCVPIVAGKPAPPPPAAPAVVTLPAKPAPEAASTPVAPTDMPPPPSPVIDPATNGNPAAIPAVDPTKVSEPAPLPPPTNL